MGATATPWLTTWGCRRSCRPSEPASCRPSVSASFTHAASEARATRCAAVGQAATTPVAAMTNRAAITAGLCRNQDPIADSPRRRKSAAAYRTRPQRIAAAYRARPQKIAAAYRTRPRRISAAYGAGRLSWTRVELSVGRGGRAQLSPGGASLARLACDLRRFAATDRGRRHTLGAVNPPGCTTGTDRRAGTTQETYVATFRKFQVGPRGWTRSGPGEVARSSLARSG